MQRKLEHRYAIDDAQFRARVTQVLEHDLKLARPITYDAWKARPSQERLLEHASALLSSQP